MDGYTSVNVYHIDRHYTGIARDFLNELVKAMKGTKWFDVSDPTTDYLTAYYNPTLMLVVGTSPMY